MSLASRLMKSTKLGGKSGVLSDVFKNKQKDYDTGIPAMNLAYSGSFDTGTTAGITVFAGKSKSFKTLFGLITCKAYMDAEPEAFMLFYNSEGGAPEQYFNQVGIDPSRVLMMDIMNIEDMQIDMVDKLEQIKAEYEAAKKGEEKPKCIVFVDSVGNLASKKEVEDAKKGHGATDMGTRAKALKAFYRIVTPYFNRLDMQMVVIGHTYDEMASMGAPKQIVSGGCLLSGTRIKLADGRLIEIQNVQVGDRVMTMLGDKEVTHVWDETNLEEPTPECYRIEFDDGYTVECSETHKFLVNIDGKQEWVEAKNLANGMEIVTM